MNLFSGEIIKSCRPSTRTAFNALGTKRGNNGFSLLELTVVVVVLGILSSVTLPRIGSFLAYSDVDSAKALLNTAAADCLQNSRLKNDDKDVIDDTIISDENLNPIGFTIDQPNNADKCSYFQLIPTDEDDTIRFPIGFSVIDGALSKFANPTSTNKGSINACKRWAGVSCKEDESLKKLVEWKNSIAAEKAKCEDDYTKWLQGGTTPLESQRWNPNADAGCPTRPPKDSSQSYKIDSCTTNGCNRTVYGLDGEFVGFTRDDYDRALEKKYGKACTEWVENKKLENYTNSPQNLPKELQPQCGSQKFWFYKGVDVGTKEEFDKRICSDNLEIEKLTSGKRTVQGCGDQIYYFSENKIHNSEREYKESSCKVDKYNKAQEANNGEFTTTEVGAEGCGTYWICDSEIVNDQESYNEKCSNSQSNCGQAPYAGCDQSGNYTHPLCAAYSRCMGRI